MNEIESLNYRTELASLSKEKFLAKMLQASSDLSFELDRLISVLGNDRLLSKLNRSISLVEGDLEKLQLAFSYYKNIHSLDYKDLSEITSTLGPTVEHKESPVVFVMQPFQSHGFVD